jgi:predicted DNA-binding transcriptional regulator AlpA
MPDRLLDILELAKCLKIPPKTIRNKLSDGTWPMRPLRIGRALRWRESDVDRTLAELATASTSTLDAPGTSRSLGQKGAGTAGAPMSKKSS